MVVVDFLTTPRGSMFAIHTTTIVLKVSSYTSVPPL